MKALIGILLACRLVIAQVPDQSLAEAARRETERRRRLEEQQVEARVIEARGPVKVSNGNLTTFGRGAARSGPPAPSRETRGRASLGSYRNLLSRLEREIREGEERQSSLRRQAEAEKWTLPKSGRGSGGTGGGTLREKLLKQAEDLEVKLKRLRRERRETWDEARKAGYLPGELDGKAVAP